MYQMSEITLCDYETDSLHLTIRARIRNGRFSILKREYSGIPEKFEYKRKYKNGEVIIEERSLGKPPPWIEIEYWYYLDKDNTELLFMFLIEDYGENDPKKILHEKFSGLDGCEKLTEYCNAKNIAYSHGTVDEVELYDHKTPSLWADASARIAFGCLSIFEHDFGDDTPCGGEVESWYNFDKDNTELLFMLLTENTEERDRKKLLLDNFSGFGGTWKLREYCKTNGIAYKSGFWYGR